MAFRARASIFFLTVITSAAIAAACGSDDSSIFNSGDDGGGSFTDGSIIAPGDGGGFIGSDSAVPVGPIVISPADKVLDVVAGGTVPTISYTATVGGIAVHPAWSIDRGEIGAIDVASGVFTPSGKLGGKATISATLGANVATTTVTVFFHVVQNGAGIDDDAGAGGAGGVGGVGGNGLGGAVPDPSIFPGTPTADANLAMLYPYDATVWPRGILPPLLQWTNDKVWDGLYLHIQEAAYEYTGTFAKPGGAASYQNSPIPIDAWNQMAESNGGEAVTITLELSVAGTVYGPLTETWKIASAPLEGTVYYNSYGTLLATNYPGALPDNHRFGAATLAIKGGSTSPVLVAGSTTADTSGCRVCHSVSGDGSQLITKQTDNVTSSVYDLHGTYGTNETVVPGAGTPNLAWPAVAPDGSFVFTDSSGVQGSTSSPSRLYWIPSGNAITTAGLPPSLRAALPAFSPDGKHVAFTWYGGAVSGFGTGDKNTLAVMDFTGPSGFEDAGGSGTFSNFLPIFNPAGADAGAVGLRAIYPSYLPTNDSIVFENELATSGSNYAETRTGAKGELWWIDVKTGTAHRLDRLNGVGALPTGGAHTGAADAQYNFEPTVNPVPSGGYAWVVFTSRRLYGNVATRAAIESDPRDYDLTTSPTPKKLWVAAIDLNAPPGTDPSHPAFYLPAQELFAGNSRGYWVVDPCRSDGTSCATGDECCGGYCRPGGDAGGLVCTNAKPTCAQVSEKCATTADCCGKDTGIQCIDDRCATPTPR